MNGLNPMARAQEELDIFWFFGSHTDLDRHDEKDEVEWAEEAIRGITGKDVGSSMVGGDEGEAPKGDALGSVLSESPPVA